MRSLIIAAITLMAVGTAPVLAKPTATQISWNLRGALAPRVDLGIGRQAPRERPAPDLPRTARAGEHRQQPRPLS